MKKILILSTKSDVIKKSVIPIIKHVAMEIPLFLTKFNHPVFIIFLNEAIIIIYIQLFAISYLPLKHKPAYFFVSNQLTVIKRYNSSF